MEMERFAQKRGYEIVQNLPSKKNQVALVRDGDELGILKVFADPETGATQREREGLVRAREAGVAVPMVRGIWYSRIMLLEYIEGTNLGDLTPRELIDVAPALARWFARLHQIEGGPGNTSFIRGDSILRNFVLMPRGGIAGVDLEEWEWGDPARDLGEVVASALTMDPPFTREAILMARRLHREYTLMAPNPGNARLQRETLDALDRMAERRPEATDALREGIEQLTRDREPFGR